MIIRAIHRGALEVTRRILGILMGSWYDSYGPYVDVAPQLGERHIRNCRFVPSRVNLIGLMPKDAVVCEVGTAYGAFAGEIVQRASPRTFHIIDRDMSLFDAPHFSKEIEGGRVVLHEGDSSLALADFEDGYFDWIYIDADHRYEGVVKDIAAARLKVMDGGFILFNDYTTWSPREAEKYGVMKAVNEFCIREDWEIVFFAFQASGYFDVAVRKITTKGNKKRVGGGAVRNAK